MREIDVGEVADYANRSIRIVVAAGREIGVIRWHDRFFALRNICPHQFGPVCAGSVHPKLVGTSVGDVSLEAEIPILSCAWHGWEFDVQSGQAIGDGQCRVRTYPVEIRAGHVYVQIR